MNRPQVEASLGSQLDARIKEGMRARKQGDFDAAVARFQEAWDLLPDPKLSWDYYGQILTRELSSACIESGDLSAAAAWVERFDEAYSPHSDASRMLVDFAKAKLFYRAGQQDLAWAYFDAIYKVKGKRVFEREDDAYYEFYRGHSPERESVRPTSDAGWATRVPEPGAGEAQDELSDETHRAIVELLAEGDNYMDLEAPQAAAEQYVAAIERLPQPYTQWEAALMLYIALADACLALTQYAEAERAARLALESPDGTGNGYVWLRLGDALHGQGRDGEALEAYTSSYMLEGEEIFADEHDAWKMLQRAGIPKKG